MTGLYSLSGDLGNFVYSSFYFMKRQTIRHTLEGKQILLTGGSGFIGKTWLSLTLDRLPSIGKIYVLMRRNGANSVTERFENLFNSSYIFEPLFQKYGKNLGSLLRSKIEVVEGDATQPHLGMDSKKRLELENSLD